MRAAQESFRRVTLATVCDAGCDRCNAADSVKAVLVQLPSTGEVSRSRADSVAEQTVNSTRRLGRLGNSISQVTARLSHQPPQQEQPAERRQQGRKDDSATSQL